MRNRREWMQAALAGVTVKGLALGAQVSSQAASSRLGMPGLYRGRVVAVRHQGSIAGAMGLGEWDEAKIKLITSNLTA